MKDFPEIRVISNRFYFKLLMAYKPKNLLVHLNVFPLDDKFR